MADLRVAIVHDRLTENGGAEKVLAEFVRVWPHADVYVPIASDSAIRPPLHSVNGTWLSGAYRGLGGRTHAPLLPMVPRAMRKLPLRGRYDIVFISHFAFATQAALAADCPTVAYVHSPARWAWDPTFRVQEAGGVAGRVFLRNLGRVARRGESRSASALTQIVANSNAVAERISEWWDRQSTVVHPPVDIDRFRVDETVQREDFFLIAGRQVPYKRADLAINAAKRAGVRLLVVGDGRHRGALESLAGKETTFLGAVPHSTLVDMFQRCRALIMPGIEDFGIVPVEAMACGTPVLAVNRGGALDYIRPGVNGDFIEYGTDDAVVADLADKMSSIEFAQFGPAEIRTFAEAFSPQIFRSRIADIAELAISGRMEPGRSEGVHTRTIPVAGVAGMDYGPITEGRPNE
jgi:glycosyltransferase involved in cell wall biosynthesis